jgi:hypothetical protein
VWTSRCAVCRRGRDRGTWGRGEVVGGGGCGATQGAGVGAVCRWWVTGVVGWWGGVGVGWGGRRVFEPPLYQAVSDPLPPRPAPCHTLPCLCLPSDTATPRAPPCTTHAVHPPGPPPLHPLPLLCDCYMAVARLLPPACRRLLLVVRPPHPPFFVRWTAFGPLTWAWVWAWV